MRSTVEIASLEPSAEPPTAESTTLADEGQAEAGASTPPALLRRFRWTIPVLLGCLAAGVLGLNLRHESVAGKDSEAQKVVTSHVEELLTYDFETMDDDLQAELGWLTGSFQGDYQDLVSETLAPAAKAAKVRTEASVVAAGAMSADGDEVTLLLFVNVKTHSANHAKPRISGSRLVVTTQFVDGAWRISDLDPV